jgi:hypothetical protein
LALRFANFRNWFTFVAKDMRLLRTIAIFTNLAFIVYGTIEWLPPALSCACDLPRSSGQRDPRATYLKSTGCPNFGRRHDMSRPIAASALGDFLADFPQHA